MTLAVLFGGQGTETARMGRALASQHAGTYELMHRAEELAGTADVRRTSVIQPLLTAVGLGAFAALRERGVTPSVVAGHSLGEVAAWSVAGAYSAEHAVELSALRGRVMEREAGRNAGGMLAVMCSEAQVGELLRIGRTAGAVALAAHNAPEEWTFSGDAKALTAIAARVPSTRLPVSGAWHSPAMAGAVDEVRAAVRAHEADRCRVVTNRTGAFATDADDVADLIAGQLVRPIQWAASMQTLAAAGVTHVVVLGPGTVMRGLVYKNLGRMIRVSIVETLTDVAAVAEMA